MKVRVRTGRATFVTEPLSGIHFEFENLLLFRFLKVKKI